MSYVVPVKSNLQKFVDFSEYMNFMYNIYITETRDEANSLDNLLLLSMKLCTKTFLCCTRLITKISMDASNFPLSKQQQNQPCSGGNYCLSHPSLLLTPADTMNINCLASHNGVKLFLNSHLRLTFKIHIFS